MGITTAIPFPFLQNLDNYLLTAEQLLFRAEVNAFFQQKHIIDMIENIQQQSYSEIDVRPLYKLMGEAGLLAVHWPHEFAGRNKTLIELAIVAEEMVKVGIAETLFILSIQIVGNLIWLIGESEQKNQWLPALGQGTQFACVLFSELQAGSDLAAIETMAVETENGNYIITGKKIYSLKAGLCDYGLCAVKISHDKSKYDGISVFILPLKQGNVVVTKIPSLADEPFYEVTFDRLEVSKTNVIGKAGDGWPVISACLNLERTGLDAVLKVNRALDVVVRCVKDHCLSNNDNIKEQINQFYCQRDAARIMTYSLLEQYHIEACIDQEKAAMSKWFASELAKQVLEFGVRNIDFQSLTKNPALEKEFSSLYRDIPGVTIAAGTSEMMLELIANSQISLS
jgi:alkylation response protein AidB-like acyl-CoA dehydrogenase